MLLCKLCFCLFMDVYGYMHVCAYVREQCAYILCVSTMRWNYFIFAMGNLLSFLDLNPFICLVFLFLWTDSHICIILLYIFTNLSTAYGQSKLANVLFSNELARQFNGTGVTSNSLHPGIIKTELARHIKESVKSNFYLEKLYESMNILFNVLQLDADGGALTQVYTLCMISTIICRNFCIAFYLNFLCLFYCVFCSLFFVGSIFLHFLYFFLRIYLIIPFLSFFFFFSDLFYYLFSI